VNWYPVSLSDTQFRSLYSYYTENWG
jgi:hypothetical protein